MTDLHLYALFLLSGLALLGLCLWLWRGRPAYRHRDGEADPPQPARGPNRRVRLPVASTNTPPLDLPKGPPPGVLLLVIAGLACCASGCAARAAAQRATAEALTAKDASLDEFERWFVGLLPMLSDEQLATAKLVHQHAAPLLRAKDKALTTCLEGHQ